MNGDKINFQYFMDTSTLDVSDLSERDDTLRLAIFNAVKDTQSVVIKPLPNVLVMNKEQFDNQLLADEMVAPDGYTDPYKPKDHLWITPLNAMDIVVKDAPSHSIT
jgi:hypothetical protein